MNTKRKIKYGCLVSIILSLALYFGAFHHIFELDYNTNFQYPYEHDIESHINQLKANLTPKVAPINLKYTFNFLHSCPNKCGINISNARNDINSNIINDIRLLFLIKSSTDHFRQRLAIRQSWGRENRFYDTQVKTIFLLGKSDKEEIEKQISNESQKYNDIVKGNFTDSYFNNTLKTMLGFRWATKFCANADFYMFVDDDYYVSTRNVLRFIRNPYNYPSTPKNNQIHNRALSYDIKSSFRLYTGYVFNSSSPLRHMSSKWYVSLEEYPYHKWPPYVTAGAYILSKDAFLDMNYASYYTRHFRFDDIYVALLALKTGIVPFHCSYFYFDMLEYDRNAYENVVASHGYSDSAQMVRVWDEQRSLNLA